MIEKEFRRKEEDIMRKRYYDSRICPDCLKPRDFIKTARGRLSTHVQCRLCGALFHVYPQTRYIERIGTNEKRTG